MTDWLGKIVLAVAFAAAVLPAPAVRADDMGSSWSRPRKPAGVRSLLLSQAAAADGTDEPPRIAPIPRQDPRAEAAAAEKKRQEELAALPAYKRWWFWALTGAVVAGTAVLAATLIDSSSEPAQGCISATIACFGDGR